MTLPLVTAPSFTWTDAATATADQLHAFHGWELAQLLSDAARALAAANHEVSEMTAAAVAAKGEARSLILRDRLQAVAVQAKAKKAADRLHYYVGRKLQITC